MTEITSIEINGKKFRSDLIDSYHNANNTEGYRVYKDGWCECYGSAFAMQPQVDNVITLPKNFKIISEEANLPHDCCLDNTVMITPSHTGFTPSSTISGAFLSSNKIKLFNSNEIKAVMSLKWEARGYLTDEEMNKYDL
jgi:hypothetical protein